MNRLGKLWSILAAGCLLASGGVLAAAELAPQWKSESAVRQALATHIEVVNWPPGGDLRDRLQRLSQWQQVAIFLDRRVDPGTVIDLDASDLTLLQLLERLAAKCECVVEQVGAVVYIGPRAEIAGLASVAQHRAREARALTAHRSATLLSARPWQWKMLAEPRSLVDELAREADVTVEAIDQLPHDLWPAVDLPPLTWTDRLTIVLAGLGWTFQFEEQGRAIRLVPLVPPSVLTRTYPPVLPQLNLESLTRQFPEARFAQSSEGVSMTGSAEDHARLRELLDRSTKKARWRGRATTVHSLRVNEQPVGAILKTLEQKLQLQLEYTAGARERLPIRVSLDVSNVTLETLLRAALTPAGLTFRQADDTLIIEVQGDPQDDADGGAGDR